MSCASSFEKKRRKTVFVVGRYFIEIYDEITVMPARSNSIHSLSLMSGLALNRYNIKLLPPRRVSDLVHESVPVLRVEKCITGWFAEI